MPHLHGMTYCHPRLMGLGVRWLAITHLEVLSHINLCTSSQRDTTLPALVRRTIVWIAVRVVSCAGGAYRSDSLESR